MNCDAALERMLEAYPQVLRGQGDDELSLHLADCPRCAAVAETLARELDALDGELDRLAGLAGARGEAHGAEPDTAAPHRMADAAADAALAASRERSVREHGNPGDATVVSLPERVRAGSNGSGGIRGPGWKTWVPLAAAAVLAGILIVGQQDRFPGEPTHAPGPSLEPRVSVTPPSDRGAAIMETENPNITIVWLYEREES